MRHTSIILFMLHSLLSGMLLASEINDESILPWTNAASKESCSLLARLSDNATIEFKSIAGQKPRLIVDIPHRSRLAKKIELHRVSPPWRNDGPRRVETLGSDYVTTTIFSKNIQPLLDKMANGYWAELRFIDDSGNVWKQSIPSVGIMNALRIYNDCRNKLPPIGLTEINKSFVPFDSGSLELNTQAKTLLLKIGEYLIYDNSIKEIHVDSHTDVGGDRLLNLELSRKRALNVEHYLLDMGIPKKLLAKVRWHGERYPLHNPEKGQSNRRVEVRLFSTRSEPEIETETKPDIESNSKIIEG